ncbi:MAG: M20/M25/M40 family metallo-hydrolase [bacterium]
MSDWAELLSALADAPRENGTPGLRAAASFIAERLELAGVEPQVQAFSAHPHDPVALGVGVFLLCCSYAWALRSSRKMLSAFVAVLFLALPVGYLDWQLPLTPGFSIQEDNIFGVIPARNPDQRIVLTAHYDTKTELTDHVVRLPVQIAGAVVGVLALLFPLALSETLRRRWSLRASRIFANATLIYGVLFLVVFAGGAFRSERSSGAFDNGAACAVLLRAATALADGPALERTEVMFVFFAAEEVGAQGSWRFVRDRLPKLPALDTYVINLDPIGASEQLTVVHREGGILRGFEPSSAVVSLLDSVHRQQTGRPIGHTSGGGLTDAFPFLASGVPAATVISAVPPFVLPRGMHTSADARGRIDLKSMDTTLEFVLRLVRFADSLPVQTRS